MQDQFYVLPFPDSIMTSDRFLQLLKKWFVPLASGVVVCVAFFGLMRYIINSEVADIRDDTGTLRSDIGTLKADLKNDNEKTNGRIDDLLKQALERAFPSPKASKNEIRGSLRETNELLKLAKSQNIKLDPQLVSNYGRQVSSLSNDPAVSSLAWSTALAFLDYKSLLNSDSLHSVPGTFIAVPPGTITFMIQAKWYGAANFEWSKESVPRDESFVFQRIDNPANLPGGNTHPFLRVIGEKGSVIWLDGFRVRNVVLENITVEYDGGPVEMDHVYFVNCTFKVKPMSSTQRFANAVLSQVPVTFRS